MLKHKKLSTITTSLFIFLGIFFIFTSNAHAISYQAQIGFGKISGTMDIGPDSIGTYITEVYKYAVGVVGILASIVIMWGGVRWLTAGGDKGAVDDAKKWIEGALSGLILVMTSYMILYFVNPDLIKFKSIKIDQINGAKTETVAPVTRCGPDNAGICQICPFDTNLNRPNCALFGSFLTFESMCNGNNVRLLTGASCPSLYICCQQM